MLHVLLFLLRTDCQCFDTVVWVVGLKDDGSTTGRCGQPVDWCWRATTDPLGWCINVIVLPGT